MSIFLQLPALICKQIYYYILHAIYKHICSYHKICLQITAVSYKNILNKDEKSVTEIRWIGHLKRKGPGNIRKYNTIIIIINLAD